MHRRGHNASSKEESDEGAAHSKCSAHLAIPFMSSRSLDLKMDEKGSRMSLDVHLNGVVRTDVGGLGSDDVISGTNDVDRGWSWVVLVASCVSVTIQETLYSAAGMFQVEFQETFGGSRGFLALIGSIFVTCSGMLGPLAGILCTQLTPRVAMMLGASLTALALVSGSFTTTSTALLFTYGCIGGLGNALIFTPSTTAFTTYFLKFRQVANGFTMASSGIGNLIGPYFVRWLIDSFGWRFSMAVSGFLAAQICVLGALIFPRCANTNTCRLFIKACFTCKCLDNKEKNKEKDRTQTLVVISEKGDSMSKGTHPGPQCGDALLGDGHGGDGGGSNGGGDWEPQDHDKTSFRWRARQVLTKKEVWVLCMNQMLIMAGYNIHVMHQPSYISSLGVDEHHFPNLFLAFGTSVMLVRVVAGFVFTRFHNHLIPAMFLCEMVMALTLGLMPLYGTSLPALYVYNVIIGLAYGPCLMLAIPVLITYAGVELLPLAYGTVLMCCGSASLVTTSLAGWIYDVSGTYKASFYLAGCLTGCGTLVLLLLLCLRKKEAEEEKEEETKNTICTVDVTELPHSKNDVSIAQ